jgi:hypothetical protein
MARQDNMYSASKNISCSDGYGSGTRCGQDRVVFELLKSAKERANSLVD